MQRNSATYIVSFAAAVCVVCSLLVSAAAVVLKDRQVANAQLDKQKKILAVSGLIQDESTVTRQEAQKLYDTRIVPTIVELDTGDVVEGKVDPATYDQQRALSDPTMSSKAPPNAARVARIPKYALVYEVKDEADQIKLYVFPVEGKGLWSTLYGFLALDSDLNTVHGITFYQHGETPGLGGEIDNPNWKAKWPGREVFGPDGKVDLSVIKGAAGPPSEAPYKVDGLSGATLTSRGVTNLVHFWMGENGFGKFIGKHRDASEGSAA